jgi:hypothetical protein
MAENKQTGQSNLLLRQWDSQFYHHTTPVTQKPWVDCLETIFGFKLEDILVAFLSNFDDSDDFDRAVKEKDIGDFWGNIKANDLIVKPSNVCPLLRCIWIDDRRQASWGNGDLLRRYSNPLDAYDLYRSLIEQV